MFTVAPLSPTMNIEAGDIFYSEVEVLNVNYQCTGTVNITVNNKIISYVPLNHSVTNNDALEDSEFINLIYKSTTVDISNGILMLALNYDGKTWNSINLPVGTCYSNENYTTVNASEEFEVTIIGKWKCK